MIMKTCSKYQYHNDNKCHFKGEFRYPYTICNNQNMCMRQSTTICESLPPITHKPFTNAIMELELE